MSGYRENSPTGSPRSAIVTSSWFTNFYMKIRFFYRTWGLFLKISEIFFYGNVRLNVWIQFSNSNRFFWPLKVGSNLKGTIDFIGDSANTKEIYIYLVDSTSWKIFSEARYSGISYFPMQATIIILLSIENQVKWTLKSPMSTYQSHSSLTHTSNPQNQKLTTIIFFWNLIWFSDTLLGHTKIYCMNISGVYTQFSEYHSDAVSQLIKSINFSLTLTSTGWLQPSKLTVFFHLPKWVKNDPDPN